MAVLNIVSFLYYWKGISVTIPMMAGFVAVGGYLALKGWRFPNRAFQLWTVFLLLFLLISIPLAYVYNQTDPSIEIPFLARNHIYGWILTFTVYRFLLFRATEKGFSYVSNGVLILCILGSLTIPFAIPLGLYSINYANMPFFISIERFSGLYYDPNSAAAVGNFTFALGLGTVFQTKGFKTLGILGIIAGFLALIAAFSKSALLALALQLFIALVLYLRSYRQLERSTRRLGNIFIGLIVGLMVQTVIVISTYYYDLTPKQRERIDQVGKIFSGKAGNEELSNRGDLTKIGLEIIAERPFFGVGFGAFMKIRGIQDAIGERVGSHNIYVRIWGESGLFALLLYLSFWAFLLWRTLYIPELGLQIATACGAIGLIVYGASAHTFFEQNHSCFFIGWLCAAVVAHRFANGEDN